MSYKNEAKFGKALDPMLMAAGYDVHNIQTPTTESGCPDRYIQKGSLSAWIELKNIKTSVKAPTILIPYRPGQQGWLHIHYKHGGKGFTAIAGSDGILFIFNNKVYLEKEYTQGASPQLYVSRLYKDTIDSWLQTFKY